MLKKAALAKKAAPRVKPQPLLQKAVALKKVIKPVLLPTAKTLPKVKYPLFYLGSREIPNLKNFSQDLGEDGDSYIITIKTSEKDKFNFKFNTSSSSHCCGFIELGDFTMPYYENEIQTEALRVLFENFGSHSEFQLFTCTIDDGCKILEDALKECKHWTKVKSFDNPNTNNLITLWVSNQ